MVTTSLNLLFYDCQYVFKRTKIFNFYKNCSFLSLEDDASIKEKHQHIAVQKHPVCC
jgi:hypothetical protein